MNTILKAENISKQYRLGTVGSGTLSDDLKRWWYNIRGKEDPFLKVGAVNDRSSNATEDYVWALRDINFEVKRGEILGIIGKNGAGKSTLLKLLSRVTAPTTGSIKTKGRIASLLEVGTGFHGELTGRENIFMNGAVLGMSKNEIKSKLDEIIAFSGCEKYIDTPVKRYSSGMTVRLGFAVAAHLEPEILVVDEVLAVGDAEFQKKAIGKMQDLSAGEGRTVLFVSHNMSSINQLCSRLTVLKNGALVYDGPTEEGLSYYLNDTNKDLISHYSALDNLAIVKALYFKEKLIRTGDDITLEFLLNENENKDVSIHVGIYNLKDQRLMHCTNEYFERGTINTSCKITSCVIPRNPLTEGIYYINFGIVFNNMVIEEKKKILQFEVINGDFFKTGKLLYSATKNSTFISPYYWI